MGTEWNTTDTKPGSSKKTLRVTTVPKGGILMWLAEGDQVMTDGTCWWIASDKAELLGYSLPPNVDMCDVR